MVLVYRFKCSDFHAYVILAIPKYLGGLDIPLRRRGRYSTMIHLYNNNTFIHNYFILVFSVLDHHLGTPWYTPHLGCGYLIRYCTVHIHYNTILSPSLHANSILPTPFSPSQIHPSSYYPHLCAILLHHAINSIIPRAFISTAFTPSTPSRAFDSHICSLEGRIQLLSLHRSPPTRQIVTENASSRLSRT